MWDVIWTDPNKELVGEHRAKKEKRRGSSSATKARDRSLTPSRHSFSTRSSVSSSDAALSFLRSQQGSEADKEKGKEKAGTNVSERKSSWRSTSWSRASSTASSALASLSIASARSPLSPTFDVRSRRSSVLTTTNESSLHSRPSCASRTTREKEEVLAACGRESEHGQSARDCQETLPAKSRSDDLLPDTDNPRRPPEHIGCSSESEVQSGNPKNQGLSPMEVEKSPQSSTHSAPPPHDSEKSRQNHCLGALKGDETLATHSTSPPTTVTAPPAVPPKSPLRATQHSSPLFAIPTEAGRWLAMEEWPSQASFQVRDDEPSEDPELLDISLLKKELEEMRVIESEAILSRIQNFPPADESSLEDLEQKRWLLCGLQHLERSSTRTSTAEVVSSTTQGGHETLLFFEPCNTVAYLAAQDPKNTFYHATRHPLRNVTYPNVIPLSLPSLTTDLIAHALPSDLDLIRSQSFPVMCPAPDMTRALICLRSHLKPGTGTLHLTLIDALPHPATLGPNLRKWIENNLIINLPPHSISHTPTRLLPKCLAAASLRGPGSRRIKTKFFACSASIRGCTLSAEDQQHEDHDPDPAIRRLRTELRVKAELRCLVGRMFWKDIWGPYTRPSQKTESYEGQKDGCDQEDGSETKTKWWWDDEACMTECLQLGTFWEYHTIEAVRDS